MNLRSHARATGPKQPPEHLGATCADHTGTTLFRPPRARTLRPAPVWKIKADYVSPRDQIVWLKIEHRNLWVAASGGMHGSTKCNAAGCNEEEKQEHLVRCPTIRREFWDKVATLMRKLKVVVQGS
jgi:hypothetical protein